jgi:hypothetical protein
MSFMLTTQQILDEMKDVTRRLGWGKLSAGRQLCACEKCMGLKPGQKMRRLKVIEVVSTRWEPLSAIRDEPDGCKREGFPDLTPDEFIAMFNSHMGGDLDLMVNRIEFKYVRSF